jgi:hypothetical protein
LDKAALAAHVRDFPEALLRERAAHFGVTINAIWVALKKLAISKKTTRYSESRYEERITFLRQLRAWVAEHGWENVVYFDHRPHGWAPRGNKVFGKITGNNHERTNLIMAQRGIRHSVGLKALEIGPSALQSSSMVRRALARSNDFNFENAISIGFRSRL